MGNLMNDVNRLIQWSINTTLGQAREAERIIIKEVAMSVPARGFIRFAGISGATAIAMGAYGAHAFKANDLQSEKLKVTYDTGYKLHLVHSVALLSMPLMKRPYLVGMLMSTGMVIFSGSCYYHALTGDPRVRWITPYGGIMLIVAWLSMLV